MLEPGRGEDAEIDDATVWRIRDSQWGARRLSSLVFLNARKFAGCHHGSTGRLARGDPEMNADSLRSSQKVVGSYPITQNRAEKRYR